MGFGVFYIILREYKHQKVSLKLYLNKEFVKHFLLGECSLAQKDVKMCELLAKFWYLVLNSLWKWR